jgi:hypothetical protein
MLHPSQHTRPGPEPASDVSAPDHPPTPREATWPTILQALREAGTRAGSTAADWWAQDTIGGRASADTTRTARAVLAGLDDGDPAIFDTLPACDLPGHGADTNREADLYTDAAPTDAPTWQTLDPAGREEAIDAYRDGFDTAVHERVAQHCRTALPDSRDAVGWEGVGSAGDDRAQQLRRRDARPFAGRRRP